MNEAGLKDEILKKLEEEIRNINGSLTDRELILVRDPDYYTKGMHAEVAAIGALRGSGATGLTMGSSNAHCPDCYPRILQEGILPATPKGSYGPGSLPDWMSAFKEDYLKWMRDLQRELEAAMKGGGVYTPLPDIRLR